MRLIAYARRTGKIGPAPLPTVLISYRQTHGEQLCWTMQIDLQSELLRMADAYTDELFPLTPVEAGRVVFPVSRLVCDAESFSSLSASPRNLASQLVKR